jgi:exosortase B
MATDASLVKQKAFLPTLFGWLSANPILVAGILSVLVPTMLLVANESWSTDQGAHGPIVLATGLWLLAREWQRARPYVDPPSGRLVAAIFIPILFLYFVSRVSHIVETEGFFMYGLVVATLFSFVGWKALKLMWFPLLYLLFVFPPPETLVTAVTNPLKVALSQGAVAMLYKFGYPIAAEGVTIQVGQYQLLVADACAGLNSLISLSAIGLFYIYLRHHAHVRYALIMFVLILPVAVFANLVRILILVLLTYHAGEAAAQGFLHDFAGMTMFLTALITIFAIDNLLGRLWPGLKGKGDPGMPPREPAA